MKPTQDTRTTAELLRDLTALNDVLYGKRDRLRRLPPGKYDEATVYAVKRSRVRAHWRRGYTAVRLAR